MIASPRKLTLQLTPLLDLMLIVIFAQYMEVHQRSLEQEQTTTQAVAEAVTLRDERDRTRHDLALLRLQLDRRDVDFNQLRDDLKKREQELTERLQSALEREERVGDIISQMFQVPPELVEKAFKPRNDRDPPRTPQEIEQLQRAFQELAQKRRREAVMHVLTFEELKKRCDIWELYVTPSGGTILLAGNTTHEFRAESVDSFQQQLYQRYKALPQPKGLVIIILSYGDADARAREVALVGLPGAMERMRADSSGRTQFEYAVLGYSPESPVTKQP